MRAVFINIRQVYHILKYIKDIKNNYNLINQNPRATLLEIYYFDILTIKDIINLINDSIIRY